MPSTIPLEVWPSILIRMIPQIVRSKALTMRSVDAVSTRTKILVFSLSFFCWMFCLDPATAQTELALFPSNTYDAWSTVDGKAVNPSWEITDGVIHLKKAVVRGGNIVTREEFSDFTLSFEFKIAPGGNSGIKYRVQAYGTRYLGFEYQIYDDEGARKVNPKNSCGAIYDLYEPNAEKKTRPAGEWNEGKIVAKGTRLEHWLNGKQIVTAVVGDPEWDRKYAASKFAETQDFGRNSRGKLMLTDHGSEFWLRNVTLEVHAK